MKGTKILTLAELTNWFDDLNKLIQDCFIAYNNLKTVDDQKGQVKFLNEDFFLFFRYQQRFMINVQLAKLLECKPQIQQRNIITLCTKLRICGYDSEITTLLSDNSRGYPHFLTREEIFESTNKIREQIKKRQKIIDKVISARNKVYAHTDIQRLVDFPTLSEIKDLLDLASSAYNNTRGLLFGIHTDFTKGIVNLGMKDVIRLINRGLQK